MLLTPGKYMINQTLCCGPNCNKLSDMIVCQLERNTTCFQTWKCDLVPQRNYKISHVKISCGGFDKPTPYGCHITYTQIERRQNESIHLASHYFNVSIPQPSTQTKSGDIRELIVPMVVLTVLSVIGWICECCGCCNPRIEVVAYHNRQTPVTPAVATPAVVTPKQPDPIVIPNIVSTPSPKPQDPIRLPSPILRSVSRRINL
jgi:hypothetical protein